MATRYCGSLRLDLRYLDTGSYTARVYDAERKRLTTLRGLYLSPFHSSKLAADCPETYDRMAEAAVRFAGYESEDVYAYADTADSGQNFIRRALNGPVVGWQREAYAEHCHGMGTEVEPASEPEPGYGLLRLIKGGKSNV